MSPFLILIKSVNCYVGIPEVVVNLASVEGQELFFKLGDSVNFAVAVINKSVAAVLDSCHKTAEADILNVKAVGLFLGVPLVAVGVVKLIKLFRKLFVIGNKSINALFITALVHFSGARAKLGLDRKHGAELACSVKEIAKLACSLGGILKSSCK